MTQDELHSTPLDAEAAEALRERMRAPGGESYWSSLHAGIMARIASAESQAWWTVLSRWTKPALAAAAVIMILATAAMLTMSSRKSEIAYDDLLEAPAQLPMQTAQAATPGMAREATFQFVMSSKSGRVP